MRRKISLFKTLLPWTLFLLLFSFSLFSFGQETIVKGFVGDKEDKPLKNAKITFLDPSRGAKFSTKSDKEGKFMKIGMPPSVYNVTVELESYVPFTSQFRLELGLEKIIKIRLEKVPPKINEDKDLKEGTDFFKQGKYKEAIESFKKVVEKFPDSAEAYYDLGLSYLRNGDVDNAIISTERVIELQPQLVEAYFALGECYFKKDESEKAMAAFSKALEFQPGNSKAYYNLGIIYSKYDKAEEAIRMLEKAIELDPKLSSAYYQAALACVKKGDIKKAIAYFEDFLRIEPDAPEASQVRSMIEELKKQIGQSEIKSPYPSVD